MNYCEYFSEVRAFVRRIMQDEITAQGNQDFYLTRDLALSNVWSYVSAHEYAIYASYRFDILKHSNAEVGEEFSFNQKQSMDENIHQYAVAHFYTDVFQTFSKLEEEEYHEL